MTNAVLLEDCERWYCVVLFDLHCVQQHEFLRSGLQLVQIMTVKEMLMQISLIIFNSFF